MAPLLERIDSQQRTLRAQNRELARAESLRRDFSANVSHEMKTPLQVIAGYAELMENGLVPPEDVARFAGVIHSESQAMRALIDDVLTLSRLDEVGAGAEDAVPVELRGTAERAIGRLQALARHVGVEVTLAGEACWTRGSETLLEQMVYNLVENGIRYNEPGGSVTVTVGREFAPIAPGSDDDATAPLPAAATLAAQAVIRVRDTGPGIPPEKREKVFERFYRLEKSRSKETGGTGLGLAIVKHAALQHGGSVEVRDASGHGAEFVVRLPLVTPPADSLRS
ncbi:sensor histidine kinase [Enterorhabdus sp. P55]|uniref:sensor histidine kinase n=1 Tax=Enterorhabdus sp. P55 TaxID=2304571 RepID=UPI00351BDFF2